MMGRSGAAKDSQDWFAITINDALHLAADEYYGDLNH